MLTLAAAAKSFFSLSVANQVLFGREYISSLWAIIFSAFIFKYVMGKVQMYSEFWGTALFK